jgi:predicted O-linked N-acetylglucosamine transferase (SPINDLY family)
LLIAAAADDTDEERARWLQECDATHQMWGQNDAATAAHINALQLHVLVDLIGRIPHNHHAVLAFRPSPVQIVAIYAATTASPFVDYFVSDIVASTPELSHLFTESLMLMPISHFVNNQRALAPVPVNPRHASKSGGEGGIAAAFNAFYKMDPSRATSWWRVLNAVPNSSIMFVKYLYWETAQSTILSHAAQHNVSRSRVAFVGKLPAFDLHLQVCIACISARAVSRVTLCCSASGTAPCSSTATSLCIFVQLFACVHATDSGTTL